MPYAEAIAEKNQRTAFLRQRNLAAVTAAHVPMYMGQASLVSPKQVRVRLGSMGGEVLVEAEHIFINRRTQPRLPDLPGLRGNPRVFTSTPLMERAALSGRLVVLDGGFIGLEFASVHARFGAASGRAQWRRQTEGLPKAAAEAGTDRIPGRAARCWAPKAAKSSTRCNWPRR